MPMFGDQMMPPGGPQGQGPAPQAPGGAPASTAAIPPRGVPPGGNVQPSPSEMALANQVYQLQQMMVDMQRHMQMLASRPMEMQVTLHRDNDGKVAGMTAIEGGRRNG